LTRCPAYTGKFRVAPIVRIEAITTERRAASTVVCARVIPQTAGLDPFLLFFEFGTTAPVTPSAEGFAAALLLPAMALGENLEFDTPLDRRFLESVPCVVRLYRQWLPRLGEVQVVAPVAVDVQPPSAVGLFFSAGLDSCYSLLRLREEVTHLIFVAEWDAANPDEPWGAPNRRRAIAEISGRFGKQLIPVRTNLTRFTKPLAEWTLHHGGALAGAGLLCGGQFRRLYIFSTFDEAAMTALGTHPDLDPLWSKSSTVFVHFGDGLNRVGKARAVAPDAELTARLFLCFIEPDSNCGWCEKCVRGMLELLLGGAKDLSRTFPSADTSEQGILELLRTLPTIGGVGPFEAQFLYVLQGLKESGRFPALARAVEELVAASRAKKAARLPIGSVDAPASGSTAGPWVTVAGWAYSEDGILRVEFFCDGKYAGWIRPHALRLDVDEAFGLNCAGMPKGWLLDVSLEFQPPGWHELVVNVITRKGAVRQIGSLALLRQA